MRKRRMQPTTNEAKMATSQLPAESGFLNVLQGQGVVVVLGEGAVVTRGVVMVVGSGGPSRVVVFPNNNFCMLVVKQP